MGAQGTNGQHGGLWPGQTGPPNFNCDAFDCDGSDRRGRSSHFHAVPFFCIDNRE
jgi:hypothetical protein